MAAPTQSITATAPGSTQTPTQTQTHLDLDLDLDRDRDLAPPSSSSPSHHQSRQRPLEMTNLESAAAPASASQQPPASTSHNLDDVAIPETSPLTSLFPPSSAVGDDGDIASVGTPAPAPAASTSTSAADSAAKQQQQPQTAIPSSNLATGSISPQSQPGAATTTTADTIVPAGGSPTSPAPGGDVPALVITLLLTSGARHPYKIDEKYLTKRNVSIPGTTESGRKDPFSISVYTLKELILREWRDEWEAQPSSPSSIRLIYFGRLLDDKAVLKGMSECSSYLYCGIAFLLFYTFILSPFHFHILLSFEIDHILSFISRNRLLTPLSPYRM